MIKLPTVKVNGQTAFVINRTQVEDDVAVAEAICRDAARYRWLREKNTWDSWPGIERCSADALDTTIDAAMKDERI